MNILVAFGAQRPVQSMGRDTNGGERDCFVMSSVYNTDLSALLLSGKL